MNASFTHYALLGSGRLARHLGYYLQSLNLPVLKWSRNGDVHFNSFMDLSTSHRLQRTVEGATHVLLAVRDEAIAPLATQLKADGRTLVHFSGALTVKGAASAHPVMTFGPSLQEGSWYQEIPFVIEEGSQFSQLLPGLPNPHWSLRVEDKPLYHALCSLAGNMTYLLWSKINDVLNQDLQLPADLLVPYLNQVAKNASLTQQDSFTGPVARSDWKVVSSHLEALQKQPELLESYKNYFFLARARGVHLPENFL